MTGRAWAAFGLAILVAGGVAVGAQGPDRWRHWAYAAPVQVAPVDAPRLVTVIVPASVTADAAPGWADLRVIDEAAREVPYILDARHSRPHREWREARQRSFPATSAYDQSCERLDTVSEYSHTAIV
jgi:hypothetical protein